MSGRQVDDLDYYLVLAKWKLAIVLEQGFQRAGDDEKLLAYGPVITRLMRSAADLAESTDYRVMRAAVCPAYGPPDVVRVEDQPSPTVAPGQVRVRVGAAAVNFPDVLLIANEYQISVPPPFVPGSEFAGVIVETGEGTEGFAVGDRVTGTGLYGAFAEEVVAPTAGLMRIPDGVDEPHRRGVRRRVPDGLPHAAVHGPRPGGRRADRARRRRRRRTGGGSARRAARAPRSRPSHPRPKSSMWQRVTAPSTSSTTRRLTCAHALKDALPGGADVGHRPGRR